jgi:hypothetical protein
MNSILKTTTLAGGIALCALLTSCVDPYAGGPGYVAPGHSSTVTTTYRTGYEVRTLPPGYRTETIGGTRYYSSNGTYYQSRSGRYVVVEAPRRYDNRRDDRRYDGRDRNRNGRDDRYDRRPGGRDVIITTLPSGYRTVKYRGRDYYQVRDVYYQRSGAGYIIVNRPY